MPMMTTGNRNVVHATAAYISLCWMELIYTAYYCQTVRISTYEPCREPRTAVSSFMAQKMNVFKTFRIRTSLSIDLSVYRLCLSCLLRLWHERNLSLDSESNQNDFPLIGSQRLKSHRPMS